MCVLYAFLLAPLAYNSHRIKAVARRKMFLAEHFPGC
jgi:hypothetical protein